jgi:DNA-binding winged helix-turn-helix (wHTH) protein
LTLDLDRRLLDTGGRPVALARKNFDLLRELVVAEGRIVSREDLSRAVWPDSVVEEATVRQNVYTLRTLLRELDPSTEYLETIPKVGYRVVAPVERIGTPAQAVPTKPAAPPPARRPYLAIAATAAVLIAGAAILAKWTAGASTGATRAHAGELIRQAWLIVDERRFERYPAAVALFDDALALDQNSAEAHAGKALVYSLNNNEPAALAEAARVRELSPVSGVPAAVRGFFQMMSRWQWSEAGRTLSVLNQQGCPDPFCRQWHALYYGLTGQDSAAVREAAAAVETFPARHAARALYGQILYWSGHNAAAIRELETVVAAAGGATHARWHLWAAQWIAGDRHAATENLLLALEPSWYRLPPEDPFSILIGQRDQYGTPDFLRRLYGIVSHNGTNAYYLAQIAIALGDVSEAVDQLDRAASAHNFFAPYAKRDPLFAPLYGNARYEAAMKKLGL